MKSYKVTFSRDGLEWDTFRENGVEKVIVYFLFSSGIYEAERSFVFMYVDVKEERKKAGKKERKEEGREGGLRKPREREGGREGGRER